MRLRDVAFQRAFSQLFVYNILFEDSEVDEQFLGIQEDSNILSITGAGCGVAGMISKRPERLDAVDINPHHLSLAALKISAAQNMRDYKTFYDLLGYGSVAHPRAVIQDFASSMPHWIQSYWKKHHKRFKDNFYEEGLTAWSIKMLRRMVGLDIDFMRTLVSQNHEQRRESIESVIGPVLRQPLVKGVVKSPLQLISLGVNYEQRERMLEAEGVSDMVGFILQHLQRIACTDLERNWFAWLHVTGHYNHDEPDAVPPYLRRDRFESATDAPTSVKYHNRNLFGVLGDAPRRTWTHYTLCDMPDWLTPELQRRLLREILRTSKDGAIVMYRTTEDDCMVDRNDFSRHFRRLDESSQQASDLDRSRQYRHVHLYEIQHAA